MGVDRPATSIGVGEAVRPPDDRQLAIRIFVDAHLGAHEVRRDCDRFCVSREP